MYTSYSNAMQFSLTQGGAEDMDILQSLPKKRLHTRPSQIDSIHDSVIIVKDQIS